MIPEGQIAAVRKIGEVGVVLRQEKKVWKDISISQRFFPLPKIWAVSSNRQIDFSDMVLIVVKGMLSCCMAGQGLSPATETIFHPLSVWARPARIFQDSVPESLMRSTM